MRDANCKSYEKLTMNWTINSLLFLENASEMEKLYHFYLNDRSVKISVKQLQNNGPCNKTTKK